MSAASTWAKPTPVSKIELAFPANVSHLMPPRSECEAALDAMPDRGAQWRQFQRRWFYDGLPADVAVYLVEGIDGTTAFQHLACIQGSFEPKHEHKEAAVAYLSSLWFQAPPASKAELETASAAGQQKGGSDAR